MFYIANRNTSGIVVYRANNIITGAHLIVRLVLHIWPHTPDVDELI